MNFKHFIALNCLDIITTYLGLTYLGLTEANPVANAAFGQYGLLLSLLAMKIVGLMVIWGIMKIYPVNIKKTAVNISCFIFVLVIINNLYHMMRVI